MRSIRYEKCRNAVERKRMIVRTFSAVFGLLIFFLLILSAYTYYATRAGILNTISAQNQNLTAQADIFTQQFYKMVRSYGINIFNSRAIKKLRTNEDISNGEYIESIRVLREDASSTDYIHSIYLYNSARDYIYCTLDSDFTHSAAPADAFFDLEAADILKNNGNLTPVFRRISTSGKKTDVISFPFYESSDGVVAGSMIINVSLSWMEQFLSTVFGLDGICLYLSTGEVILNAPGITPFLENDSAMPEELLSGNSEYIIRTLDGEKYIIFGVKNEQLGWGFIRYLKYSDCLHSALSLMRNLIVLTGLMALISAGIFIYFFKKFYEPIETLLETLPSPISSMDQALSNASSELKKNSEIIRTEFLKKLVLFGSADCTAEALRARDIAIDVSTPAHMILFRTVASQNEIEGLFAGTVHECVPVPDRHVAIVQSDSSVFLSIVRELSRISSFCAYIADVNFQSLHDGYCRLDDIYALRFFLPEKDVYTVDVLDGREDSQYPHRLENRITSSLSSGNAEKAMQLFDEFIASLSGRSTPASLQAHLKKLYCSVAAMGDFEKSDIDSGTYYCLNFASLSSLADLKALFSSLFLHISELSLKHKELEEAGMVKRVKKYIKDNFFDINLSSSYLAELEGVSTNYLCDIFKRFDEISLQKYITQYRLERSCELLRSTNMPITGIAQAVGFATPQYIYTIFKSYYNMTPSTYRESAHADV